MNFVCALGHGDPAKLFARSPRLTFEEACRVRMTALASATDWVVALPIVGDPLFYMVAVPAVLIMGLSKSGFLGGFGALAVPMLSLAVPVPQARGDHAAGCCS